MSEGAVAFVTPAVVVEIPCAVISSGAVVADLADISSISSLEVVKLDKGCPSASTPVLTTSALGTVPVPAAAPSTLVAVSEILRSRSVGSTTGSEEPPPVVPPPVYKSLLGSFVGS